MHFPERFYRWLNAVGDLKTALADVRHGDVIVVLLAALAAPAAGFAADQTLISYCAGLAIHFRA
jgi:hypothetical protein